MLCPQCQKPLLTPDLLGFWPGVQWVHICDVPASANDEKEATNGDTPSNT